MRGTARALLGAAALAVLATACTMTPPPPDYAAIIAAPDRTDADRKNDDRREPVKLLAFTGVRPGWKVLDMAAGAGYSTEIMARGAAPNGTVYAQNPPDLIARAKDGFTARMQHSAMKSVIDDTRPFDDPLPANVSGLDLITFFFGYHDTTYMKVDRAKMNSAMFNALKPGGYLVVADYEALPGAPITTGKTFHRLDEDIEKREIEAAGFKLVDEGMFLRNPADTHDFIIFNAKIPIDIYVLKFQRPG
jgi:predicted methyltransferase